MSEFKTFKRNNPAGGKLLMIQWQGKTQTVGEWAEHYKVSKTTLINRISKGWPPEKIMAGSTKPRGNLRVEAVKQVNGASALLRRSWV